MQGSSMVALERAASRLVCDVRLVRVEKLANNTLNEGESYQF